MIWASFKLQFGTACDLCGIATERMTAHCVSYGDKTESSGIVGDPLRLAEQDHCPHSCSRRAHRLWSESWWIALEARRDLQPRARLQTLREANAKWCCKDAELLSEVRSGSECQLRTPARPQVPKLRLRVEISPRGVIKVLCVRTF